MPAKRELKLKARNSDPIFLESALKRFATYKGSAEYVDTFFENKTGQGVFELRVRKGNTKKQVTLKVLSSTDHVQINDIYEFEGVSPSEFVAFLESIGLRPTTLLRKKSKLYVMKGISIEVASVEKVGNFVELTLLSSDVKLAADTKRVRELATKLGIQKQDIDLRYYGTIS